MPIDPLPPVPHSRLAELLRLWNAKRGQRTMPARGDFDVIEFRQWLGNLMLLEVIGACRDFRYRVYGTALAGAFGAELTGRLVSAVPARRQPISAEDCMHVCRSGTAFVSRENRPVGRKPSPLQKLMLPLSADGHSVDMILVAVYDGDLLRPVTGLR